jgi:hypothetical protein
VLTAEFLSFTESVDGVCFQNNYGTNEGQPIEMVSHRSKESRKIKGVLDEVDLNTLILSSVVCFFVTFGVKATQSTKENAIKNFVVLVGGIVLFGLLMATGNFNFLSCMQFSLFVAVAVRANGSMVYVNYASFGFSHAIYFLAVMKVILLHHQAEEEKNASLNTPNTLV